MSKSDNTTIPRSKTIDELNLIRSMTLLAAHAVRNGEGVIGPQYNWDAQVVLQHVGDRLHALIEIVDDVAPELRMVQL
ncbi:MAG: hypothetical protein ABI645_00435 [Pseudomonadota bacterium]